MNQPPTSNSMQNSIPSNNNTTTTTTTTATAKSIPSSTSSIPNSYQQHPHSTMASRNNNNNNNPPPPPPPQNTVPQQSMSSVQGPPQMMHHQQHPQQLHPQQQQQHHHYPHHPPPPPPPQQQPSNHHAHPVYDLLDALRTEYDKTLSHYQDLRVRCEESESKVGIQIQELSAFQKSLFTLEQAHQSMKSLYEEEILRLRRELESRNIPIGPSKVVIPNTSSSGSTSPTLNGGTVATATNTSAKNPPPVLPVGSGTIFGHLTGMANPQQQQQQQNQQQNSLPQQNQQQLQRRSASPTPQTALIKNSITGFCDFERYKTISPATTVRSGSDWAAAINSNASLIPDPSQCDLELVHTFPHESVVCCVKFSPCGKFMATGSNKLTQVFEVASGKLVGTFADPSTPAGDFYIRSVVFSPNSNFIAEGGEDRIVRVWNVSTRKIQLVLRGHEQEIYSLDWSKDGHVLVSGSGDKTVRVWNAERGECMMTLFNERDLAPCIPDASHASQAFYQMSLENSGVTSVQIHPVHGRCVVAGSLDKMIRVWDLRSGKCLERFEGHKDSVYSVAFSKNGKSIVSGSLDQSVKIWDLSQSTLAILESDSSSNSANSPNTNNATPKITAVARHTFVIGDVPTLSKENISMDDKIMPPASQGRYVLSVTFGHAGFFNRKTLKSEPDHENSTKEDMDLTYTVLSSNKDCTVTCWDGQGGLALSSTPGQELAVRERAKRTAQFVLRCHENSVISIASNPVEAMFATGSGDQRARVWRVKMKE